MSTSANDSKPKHAIVTEGSASILFNTENEVFYNPPQVFNRDLSTLVLRMFVEDRKAEHLAKLTKKAKRENKDKAETEVQAIATGMLEAEPYEGITVLEALSATGLRSIRYFKEVEGIKHIVANDIEAAAVDAINRNIAHNGVDPSKIIANEGDAIDVLYQHRAQDKRFDCIDLDPYGTASPFIDGAVQAVADGGLLCVTCTDMQVMCAGYPEVCHAKYGAVPVKSKFCHEFALRMLLHTLETSANRYSRYIVPYLSITIDFYIRVFVKVYTQPAQVKQAFGKKAMVYLCSGCGTFHEQPIGRVSSKGNSCKFTPAMGPPTGPDCDTCGERFHMGGPYYSAPIHDRKFVDRCISYLDSHSDMYASHKKIYGVLSMIAQEHEVPLFMDLPSMTSVLKCQQPSLAQIKSAMFRLGYKCTQPYSLASGIKTDAPISVLWDILRCWVKENPVKGLKDGSPGKKILEKEPSIECDFTVMQEFKVKPDHARFVINPEGWGPKARAATNTKRKAPEDGDEEAQKGKHARNEV